MATDERWGSVTLSRKFFESRYWKESREFSEAEAWIDLIQRAVFKVTTVHIAGCAITLSRGEFCYAIRTLAEDWRWSKSKVQRFLAELVKYGRLTTRKAIHSAGQEMGQVPAIYRLVNYDAYQLAPARRGTVSGTESGTSKNTRIKNTVTTSPEAEKSGSTPPALPSPEKSWTAEAIDIARAAGFFWPGGRVTGALSPLVKEFGWDRVKKAWAGYLKNRPFLEFDLRAEAGRVGKSETAVKDTRFVSPNDFANNFGLWENRAKPISLAKAGVA